MLGEVLSWPFFTEEHRRFASELSLWAEATLPGILVDDVDSSCRAIVRALGGEGFLRAMVTKAHGGFYANLDVRTIALGREILSYHCGLADSVFAMQGLGSGPITLHGSDEIKKRYLSRVREGKCIAGFAMSEPDAGSDVAALSVTATRDGDSHVRIDGRKTWISNGGIADFYVVFARTGEAAGAKGLSAFIVDADAPGLSIHERIQVIAPQPIATLDFEGVRIPLTNRLGAPGEGFKVAMSNLDIFRSTVGAAAVGFARRALHESVERANSRQIFGGLLADLQLTQAAIAESATEVDAAALLVYRAAWTKDNGSPRITREASMAKFFATEAAQRVVDRAVQLHGGLGVTKGIKVEELYREIRSLRIYEGASEVQKVVIGRDFLKQHALK